jgi:hypothetical protein
MAWPVCARRAFSNTASNRRFIDLIGSSTLAAWPAFGFSKSAQRIESKRRRVPDSPHGIRHSPLLSAAVKLLPAGTRLLTKR